jgi:hypothetical protein
MSQKPSDPAFSIISKGSWIIWDNSQAPSESKTEKLCNFTDQNYPKHKKMFDVIECDVMNEYDVIIGMWSWLELSLS